MHMVVCGTAASGAFPQTGVPRVKKFQPLRTNIGPLGKGLPRGPTGQSLLMSEVLYPEVRLRM